MDLSARLREAGWQLLLDPGIGVSHQQGTSSAGAKHLRRLETGKSRNRYLREKGPVRGRVIQVIDFVGFVVRGVVHFATGHRPAAAENAVLARLTVIGPGGLLRRQLP